MRALLAAPDWLLAVACTAVPTCLAIVAVAVLLDARKARRS